MIKKIPQNIQELSKNNINILNKYNINREYLALDFNKSIKIGKKCLSQIFLENGIDFDFTKKRSNYGIRKASLEKEKLILEILNYDLGFIIVRPEMFHITDRVCSFLRKNNFKINFLIEKKIKIEEYFNLYNKEIINNLHNFSLVLPSRTLAYTNAKSSIIIFSRNRKNTEDTNIHLADLFFKKFKGNEGVKLKNTIRGDIIHEEAKRLGFNALENDIISTAIDPFATYCNLIKKKVGDYYHLQSLPEFYLLMYTAQGIHCSNHRELYSDLSSVLSLEQLLELKVKLKKYAGRK